MVCCRIQWVLIPMLLLWITVSGSEDHVEEIRLAPKKNPGATASPKPSGLAPKDDDYDFDSKGKVSEPKPQAASAPKEAQPAKPAPA